jgi:hypothetical protein
MSAAPTHLARAGILAAAVPHASDFLNAAPCSSVGTRLDDTSLHRVLGLQYVLPIQASGTNSLTVPVLTVSPVANQPVVICVTMQ